MSLLGSTFERWTRHVNNSMERGKAAYLGYVRNSIYCFLHISRVHSLIRSKARCATFVCDMFQVRTTVHNVRLDSFYSNDCCMRGWKTYTNLNIFFSTLSSVGENTREQSTNWLCSESFQSGLSLCVRNPTVAMGESPRHSQIPDGTISVHFVCAWRNKMLRKFRNL